MGHEYRDRHLLENVARRSSQDHLAYPRPPVGAHHDQIDAEVGKRMLSDHFDVVLGRIALNRHGLCGHADRDPAGIPEWDNPPYYPIGAVSAKVTTADLARSLTFWGRIGHPCGETFDAAAFLEQHPQFRWQATMLRDLKPQPWSLLELKRRD